jgi:heat shock protein HspQ
LQSWTMFAELQRHTEETLAEAKRLKQIEEVRQVQFAQERSEQALLEKVERDKLLQIELRGVIVGVFVSSIISGGTSNAFDQITRRLRRAERTRNASVVDFFASDSVRSASTITSSQIPPIKEIHGRPSSSRKKNKVDSPKVSQEAESDDELHVQEFQWEGVMFLIDPKNGVLYDATTHAHVGHWRSDDKEIDWLHLHVDEEGSEYVATIDEEDTSDEDVEQQQDEEGELILPAQQQTADEIEEEEEESSIVSALSENTLREINVKTFVKNGIHYLIDPSTRELFNEASQEMVGYLDKEGNVVPLNEKAFVVDEGGDYANEQSPRAQLEASLGADENEAVEEEEEEEEEPPVESSSSEEEPMTSERQNSDEESKISTVKSNTEVMEKTLSGRKLTLQSFIPPTPTSKAERKEGEVSETDEGAEEMSNSSSGEEDDSESSEEEVLDVTKFVFDNLLYLKDQHNKLYDSTTHDYVGRFDSVTKTIDFDSPGTDEEQD